jgi:hypothetical protein
MSDLNASKYTLSVELRLAARYPRDADSFFIIAYELPLGQA